MFYAISQVVSGNSVCIPSRVLLKGKSQVLEAVSDYLALLQVVQQDWE